jgi:hypothetical protein
MTEQQANLWLKIWNELPRVSVVIACMGFIWAVVSWATGGVRAQNSIDIAALRVDITDLQRQLAQMQGRVDGMWRPADYAERDGHFARLDSVYESLRDRVTAIEYAEKDMTKSLAGLTTVPPRR